jgi:hypothetical protein
MREVAEILGGLVGNSGVVRPGEMLRGSGNLTQLAEDFCSDLNFFGADCNLSIVLACAPGM